MAETKASKESKVAKIEVVKVIALVPIKYNEEFIAIGQEFEIADEKEVEVLIAKNAIKKAK
jgi:hypothetical protein